MRLDIDYVRQQFNQLQDEPELVFAANAGGSYVANPVNDLLEQYNRHSRVQPYSNFSPSREAGVAMDRARQGWAEALGISQDELTIGPSTSINTYVMSQAIGVLWKPGDEIIVTNQDHEANSGVWRRKAIDKGVEIHQWEVDPATGLLDPEQLIPLLNAHTRWVFFPHCSNIVGTTNPVQEIVKLVKTHSQANTFVDAVAYAPHHIADLKALGVDAYVFSLYKVFGPHQSIMYINQAIQEDLVSQAHYFLSGTPSKNFNPAGPQHAQVAACAGVLDYFDSLHQHHFGASDATRPQKLAALHGLIQAHENALCAPILDYLNGHTAVRLIGKTHCQDGDRAPTIAFQPLKQNSASLAQRLQGAGIGTENGDFYAHRLISDLRIDPEDGVVRLSLVHYNQMQDVERILQALELALQ